MEPIRVFVVDDHPMIRHGLAAMLKAEQGMTWVGDAADGSDAVRSIPVLAPDVVLMDLVMPRMDGVDCIRALRPLLPKTKFVILTSLLDPAEVRRAMDAGACGYLLKSASIAYKLFKADGTPLRATISATFVDAVEDQTRVALAQDLSPDLTHVRVLRAGETLAGLCQQIYGDPALYLKVARANQFDSVRRLPAGTRVRFPPLQK